MAWWNPGTTAGRWISDAGATVWVQDLKTILHELTTAINEREAIFERTLTTFYVADGSQKSYPSAADFSGFKLTGTDSKIGANIARMRTGIQGMLVPQTLGAFVAPTAPHTNVLSITDVLGAGYWPAGWVPLDRFQSARIWMQIRDALDLMRCIAWRTYPSDYTGCYGRSSVVSWPDCRDSALVWHSGRPQWSYDVAGDYDESPGWEWSRLSGAYSISQQFSRSTILPSTLSGDLVAWYWTLESYADTTFTGDLAVQIGGNTYAPTASGEVEYVDIAMGTADLDFSMTLLPNPIPDAAPFSGNGKAYMSTMYYSPNTAGVFPLSNPLSRRVTNILSEMTYG